MKNVEIDEKIKDEKQDDNKQLDSLDSLELTPPSPKVEETKNIEVTLPAIRYIKEDSLDGYIFDENEIADYKRKQQIDILSNSLLGQFDDEGNYFLTPEILQELQNAKKEVIEHYKTYLFLHSIHSMKNFGIISFLVSVFKENENNLKSKLVLLEKVNRVNGSIINTNSIVIDEYSAPQSEHYYEDMKKKFNIVFVDKKDIDGEKDIDDLHFCEIRKLQIQETWNASKKQIEKMEKSIFEKKIKSLSSLNDNQFAKGLLDLFYEKSAQIDKIFLQNSKEKYIALNALLDDCFEQMRGKNKSPEKVVAKIFFEQAQPALSQLKVELEKPKIETKENNNILSETKENKSENKHSSFDYSNKKDKGKNTIMPGSNVGQTIEPITKGVFIDNETNKTNIQKLNKAIEEQLKKEIEKDKGSVATDKLFDGFEDEKLY